MGFLSRFFKKSPDENAVTWPNHSTWAALKNQETVQTAEGPRFLWTVPCGELAMPSGRLVACDPFVFLAVTNNRYVPVPKGCFPVFVTLADVSAEQNRSHVREAYASIIFSPGKETRRKALSLVKDGEIRPEPKGDRFAGFGVDSGTACFVDDSVIGLGMPDPKTWYDGLFENSDPNSWFNRMDDPNHIRAGIANIVLPLAKQCENLILFHSGWGDGVYPVIGSFDSAGQLLAVHIDFFVVPDAENGATDQRSLSTLE
jgi:hypothetical protein